MKIDRCVCFQVTFSTLKGVAREVSCSRLEELQRHITFGQNCKLCHPYVRRMLETGETTFSEVLAEEEKS